MNSKAHTYTVPVARMLGDIVASTDLNPAFKSEFKVSYNNPKDLQIRLIGVFKWSAVC